ncbi:MAG: J domain-containing protein [Myxococcota bacterium]|nr:J domain-containing protein [Myxococcota bacterium]
MAASYVTARQQQDHYEVLGVSPDAPDSVIRTAYRALASKHHPDRNQDDPDAELKLKRLNAAFQVLSDPAKRRHYDELLRSPQSGMRNGLDSEPAPWKTTAPNEVEPTKRRLWPAALLLGLALVVAIAGARRLLTRQPALAQSSEAHSESVAGLARTAPALSGPYIVPLLPNETPPPAPLNYFEPAAPSVALIADWYEACQSGGPLLDPVRKEAYCACAADVRRRKFGPKTVEGPLTATETNSCLAAARTGVPSTYAFASPASTIEIWKDWTRCREREGAHGSDCACAHDLELAVKSAKVKSSLRPLLSRRCEMEHRYWETTKKHLTLRQFIESTPTPREPAQPFP